MTDLNGKSRPGVIGKDPRTGEDVVSAKEVLKVKGPYAAIDMVAPGARLQMVLDSAQNFRSMYPNEPKRNIELVADEVLRLRTAERAWNQERETLRTLLMRESEQHGETVRQHADLMWATSKQEIVREASRWFRLGRWMGFYR